MGVRYDLTEFTSELYGDSSNPLQLLDSKFFDFLNELNLTSGDYLSRVRYLTTGLKPEDGPTLMDTSEVIKTNNIIEKITETETELTTKIHNGLSQAYVDHIYQYLIATGLIPTGYLYNCNLDTGEVFKLSRQWTIINDILWDNTTGIFVHGFGLMSWKTPEHNRAMLSFFMVCKNSTDYSVLSSHLSGKMVQAISTVNLLLYEDHKLQQTLVRSNTMDVLFMFHRLPIVSTGGDNVFRFTRKFKEVIPAYKFQVSVDNHSIIQHVECGSGLDKSTPHFVMATIKSGSRISVILSIPTNHIPYLVVVDGQSFSLADRHLLNLKGIDCMKTQREYRGDCRHVSDEWELVINSFTKEMTIHLETCEDTTMKVQRCIVAKTSSMIIREELVQINIKTLYPLVWLDDQKIHVYGIMEPNEEHNKIVDEITDFSVVLDKFLYTEDCITTTLPYHNPDHCGYHHIHHHHRHDHRHHSDVKPLEMDILFGQQTGRHDKPVKLDYWVPDYPGRMNPNPTIKYETPTGFSEVRMHPCKDGDKYVSFHIATCSGICISFTEERAYDKYMVKFDNYSVAINLHTNKDCPLIIVPAVAPVSFSRFVLLPEAPEVPPVEDYPVDTEKPEEGDDSQNPDNSGDDSTGDNTGDNVQTKVILAGKLSYVTGTRIAILRTLDNYNKIILLKAPLPLRYGGELLDYKDDLQAKVITVGKAAALIVEFQDGKEITEWVDSEENADYEVVMEGKLMYFPAKSIIVITDVSDTGVSTMNFTLENPLPTKTDGSSLLDSNTMGKVLLIGSKQAVIITNSAGEEFFEWIVEPPEEKEYMLIETRVVQNVRYDSNNRLLYAEYGIGYSMVIDGITILNTTTENTEFYKPTTFASMDSIELCKDAEYNLHAIFVLSDGQRIDTTILDVYTGQRTEYGNFLNVISIDDETDIVDIQTSRFGHVQFGIPYNNDRATFTHFQSFMDNVCTLNTTGMINAGSFVWMVFTMGNESAFVAKSTFVHLLTEEEFIPYNCLDVSAIVYSAVNGYIYAEESSCEDNPVSINAVIVQIVQSDTTNELIFERLKNVNHITIGKSYNQLRLRLYRKAEPSVQGTISKLNQSENTEVVAEYSIVGDTYYKGIVSNYGTLTSIVPIVEDLQHEDLPNYTGYIGISSERHVDHYGLRYYLSKDAIVALNETRGSVTNLTGMFVKYNVEEGTECDDAIEDILILRLSAPEKPIGHILFTMVEGMDYTVENNLPVVDEWIDHGHGFVYVEGHINGDVVGKLVDYRDIDMLSNIVDLDNVSLMNFGDTGCLDVFLESSKRTYIIPDGYYDIYDVLPVDFGKCVSMVYTEPRLVMVFSDKLVVDVDISDGPVYLPSMAIHILQVNETNPASVKYLSCKRNEQEDIFIAIKFFGLQSANIIKIEKINEIRGGSESTDDSTTEQPIKSTNDYRW